MKNEIWATKPIAVASLHLDSKNPRLGRETSARAPREIIQYLFDNDKAIDVASSIATRGFFPNEPLLAVRENEKLVIVEGNRRLAALKALREPGLLEGPLAKQIERLSKRITDKDQISTVPVTVAPNRRATDRLIAGRHIGTPVLAWQAENRASFILDKLDEGYNNLRLHDELGFSDADIQKARQTRAIADMARSLELPDEVKAKLDNPRAKIFSTLERVFDSTVGRQLLQVIPDPEHGLRGTTKKTEFVRVFTKLVTDVALGNASSRTLNSSDNIENYFHAWPKDERPTKKAGTFVPSDVIGNATSTSSLGRTPYVPDLTRSKRAHSTVLPKDLKVRYGSERLKDIRLELTKLKRVTYPNAGAVLLRVFFELTVVDYLKRSGDMEAMIKRLGDKANLKNGVPVMRQMVPEVIRIAKEKLSQGDATRVEKAVRYDDAAPFSLSDLHSFVHQSADMPTEKDIYQFWIRTEPMFRLMLEKDVEVSKK